jgi:hypothetical protein
VPADHDQSADEYQRETVFLRGRRFFPQDPSEQDRRQEQARDAEAEGRNIPCVEIGRDGQPGDSAPNRPKWKPQRGRMPRLSDRSGYLTGLDWTERRPHIAGALGAALTKRYFDLGWAERMNHSRAVIITAVGKRGFSETFGIGEVEVDDPVR